MSRNCMPVGAFQNVTSSRREVAVMGDCRELSRPRNLLGCKRENVFFLTVVSYI